MSGLHPRTSYVLPRQEVICPVCTRWITLTGEHLTRTDVNRLQAALAESSLPYQFDISLFASLKSDELVDHIRRRGIVIYQK